MRNVLIAIGNSGRPELAASAEALLRDASPLVRAMAVWALGRLAPEQARSLAAARSWRRRRTPDVRQRMG